MTYISSISNYVMTKCKKTGVPFKHDIPITTDQHIYQYINNKGGSRYLLLCYKISLNWWKKFDKKKCQIVSQIKFKPFETKFH